MRTMFVSHELNPSKKKFQKPNILRRKPKVSVQRADVSHVNTSLQVITSVTQNESFKENPIRLHVELSRPEISTSFQNTDDNLKKYIVTSNMIETNVTENNIDSNINKVIFENNTQINNNENYGQELLNVESFLNDAARQNASTAPQKKETYAKEYWCFELVNESKEIIVKPFPDSGSQLSHVQQKPDHSDAVSSTALSSVQHLTLSSPNTVSTTVSPSQNLSNDRFMRGIKFKCDEPNCKKGFWSELKLKKHKGTHNKQSKAELSDITAKCPIKNVNKDGVEEQCGRAFLTTEDLLKHLNEDHTPDDAVYRCTACGVVSLRGSGASDDVGLGDPCTRRRSSRGPLTCSWPGCGRVFQQPCRLREHARAHTGDRPYPCHFPNCGWSFRSASKLRRHARRHTGDRRHACAACGRAFLRREHLRDHCARTHPDHSQTPIHDTYDPNQPPDSHAAPAICACTYPECSDTFTSASALFVHTSQVHKKAESISSPPAPKKGRGNMFVVSIVPESENKDTSATISETALAERSIMEEMEIEDAEEVTEVVGESSGEVVNAAGGEEWHAARTHCTWPLPARYQPLYEHSLDSAYVLEEDASVEQSEGSESNIYTIRSDLFLHGNVLINEDSEFIVSREYLGRSSSGVSDEGGEAEEARDHSGTSHSLDAGLDLIDSHPTIDLMQEELMYADAAVDESSFRVFFT